MTEKFIPSVEESWLTGTIADRTLIRPAERAREILDGLDEEHVRLFWLDLFKAFEYYREYIGMPKHNERLGLWTKNSLFLTMSNDWDLFLLLFLDTNLLKPLYKEDQLKLLVSTLILKFIANKEDKNALRANEFLTTLELVDDEFSILRTREQKKEAANKRHEPTNKVKLELFKYYRDGSYKNKAHAIRVFRTCVITDYEKELFTDNLEMTLKKWMYRDYKKWLRDSETISSHK